MMNLMQLSDQAAGEWPALIFLSYKHETEIQNIRAAFLLPFHYF